MEIFIYDDGPATVAHPKGARHQAARRERSSETKTRMLIPLHRFIDVIVSANAGTDHKVCSNRLRYLVRNEFPREFSTGPGRSTVFDLEDGLKAFVAFEVFKLGGSNAVVAEALLEAWPEVLRSLLASGQSDRKDEAGTFIVLTGELLARDDERRFDISVCEATELAENLMKRGGGGLVLRGGDIISRFRDAVVENLVAHARDFDEEVELLRLETFGPGAY